MPRLILLNGPPGCGKTTIAQMYVDDHPLALNLDVDRVRRMIGGWQDLPDQSGLLARQIALDIAKVHLRAGHDVVVPQYLGQVDFVEQLQATAADTPAEFHEIVLMTTRETAVRRFNQRSQAAADPTHIEAEATALREGGLDPVGTMYDRLHDLLTHRPAATVVQVAEDDSATTYQQVLRGIG